MTEQVLDDDVFALFSRFDLDWGSYRIFPKEETAEPAEELENPIYVTEPEGKPPEDVAYSGAPRRSDVSTSTIEAIPAVRSNRAAELSEPEVSRVALQNLLYQMMPALPHQHQSADSLAAASISVHGAAGGVGSTTIAAMLTRMLAKSGKRCAILDETGDETLPIFFGAQRVAEDHRRFSGLLALSGQGVKILSLDRFETTAGQTSAEGNFIEKNFAEAACDFDHLVVDHRARSAESMGAAITVYVAIPDLSSLAGIRRLMRIRAADDQAKCVCILNRFDSKNALHQELFGWYRENFLNLATIRESPLVPEALAEGTTVIDWAPESFIAGDFACLFKAMCEVLAGKKQREMVRCN